MALLFEWSKEYETNQERIDEQHKGLVNLTNEIAKKVSEKNLSKEELDLAFKELIDYAASHFYDEEMLMMQKKIYKDFFQEHIKAHKMFVEQINQLYSEIDNGVNKEAVKNLLEFLISWLGFHILGTDQMMAKQIALIDDGIPALQAYEQVVQFQNKQVGPLVKALNGLVNVVIKRNAELLELKRSLELQVKEKTRELAATNQTLKTLALTDSLTNLANRRHLFEVLETILAEAKENLLVTSGLMIDLDNFKEVNDNYGHEMGDKVLKEFSRAVKEAIRTDDLLARLGGDEFFVLLPDTNLEGALILANNLLETVRKLDIQVGVRANERWKSSISIGLASIQPDKITNPNDFMKKTDLAVYAAKNAGKNCIKIYSEEI